ncbi:MAG: RNA methyltransferase [Patescibacteria group bacterium]
MTFLKYTTQEMLAQRPTVGILKAKPRLPFYAAFENIRSLNNVGAMFRTSDSALVSKIFLTGTTGQPPHSSIDKTALGATDVVPWEYLKDSRAALLDLKAQGVSIVALEITKESIAYTDLTYSFPVCLIVGNEVTGVSDELLDICNAAVQIPMLGRARSLNVATAYGIALFEILRQYRNLGIHHA